MNQLQWSRHHWFILLAFLMITGIEAHVGKQQGLYSAYAQILSTQLGLSWDLGLWIVVCAKLALVLFGAMVVASAVWFVGNFLGVNSSQRVLFRRLSVVFTLAMAAYTATHLISLYPWMETASLFLNMWAVLLGYFAIREQFELNHLETAFVGVFTALMVLCSWHYSNRVFEKSAQQYLTQLAHRSAQHRILR